MKHVESGNPSTETPSERVVLTPGNRAKNHPLSDDACAGDDACTPAWSEGDRAFALAGGLKAALKVALLVFGLQAVLAFVGGELSWVAQRPGGGGLLVSIQGGQALLFPRAFDIIFWDVFLFGAAMLVLHRPGWLTPALESLTAFTLCLLLWRIVVINLGMIAFPSWVAAEVSRNPGVVPTLFYVAILVAGKETIYRRLARLDGELDSPLLAFFAWHHRKDAVFNILYGLTIFGSSLGFSPERLFMLFAFVKISLLGSAALDISGRCLHRLIPEGAAAPEADHEDCP